MLRILASLRLLHYVNLVLTVNLIIPPARSEVIDRTRSSAIPIIDFARTADRDTFAFRLTTDQPVKTFERVLIKLPSASEALLARGEVSVVLRCILDETATALRNEVHNLTEGCRSISVHSTGPVTVELPYRTDGVERAVEESAIRMFRADIRVASNNAIQPLDSFVDVENRRVVATLREQSGQYIAGALKSLERPDRAPANLDGSSMSRLLAADPLAGVPLVEKPHPSPTGDARLTYPLDLAGARPNFRPSVSIGYASKSGYGTLGEGWHLNVPDITVETRWGVPIYDPDFETETYLFGGEQLVPETGDALVGDPADTLKLLPMPHRTTYLRPRKTGQARFVLRRDDGLWRFIRHGDGPDAYWWEAWQERPPAGMAPRVSYFGRAPGRVPSVIEPVVASPEPSFAQTIGPASVNPRPDAQSRWLLAREVDHHLNVIDYDWEIGCESTAGGGACATEAPEAVAWRGALLRRIQYTSNLATEETVLRCRERGGSLLPGCRGDWAFFEALLTWLPHDDVYRRSDARSGGLVVQSRLLDRIDVRTRQVRSPRLGEEPLDWHCSRSVAGYGFAYRREFASAPTAGDVSEGGTGRAFLKSITKRVSTERNLFGDRDQLPPGGCAPPDATTAWEASYTTRFDYDLQTLRDWEPARPTRASFEKPALSGLIDFVRDALFDASGATGPAAAAMLGTSATTDSAASFFAGLNFFNPGKVNAIGVKTNSSRRTGFREATLLLDADGDGITDLVVRRGPGAYDVHRGVLDAAGHLTFAARQAVDLPAEFPAFNREPLLSTDGFAVESHLFGTFFGVMSSTTSAMQDTFVADVNGDGRPDVVSPDGVYFNTSEAGRVAFGRSERGGYIDRAAPAGVPPAKMPDLLAAARAAAQPQLASADAPRVDAVRAWRAPFSGDVLVHGSIVYAPGPRPSEAQETPGDPGRADHRDGLILTVELNRRQSADGSGPVVRCFAVRLDAPRTLDLVTPQPDTTGPVPIVACQEPGRVGWPTLPTLPAALGGDKGLLVGVEAGDVLFVRAHAVDNAQDDVVRFDPAIDYVRLSEDAATPGSATVQRDIIFGAGAAAGAPGVEAAVASVAAVSSRCTTLKVTDAAGATARLDEAAAGLCDPWGRSIVRYRAAEEKDPFVNAGGLFIAPYAGRARFEGTLDKPNTLLAGEVAVRILPPPPTPSRAGTVAQEDSGCAPGLNAVAGTELKTLVRFGQAAGRYSIDPDASLSLLQRGQRVCVFLRFFALDTGTPDAVWPLDLSAFSWVDGAVSAVFDRKLLTVQLDRPDRVPEDLLSQAERSAAVADLGDCPRGAASNISVRVPGTGEDRTKPEGWTGSSDLQVHLRCIVVEGDRHRLTPRSGGTFARYVFPDGTGGAAARRFARRLAPVRLPPSALACPADGTLREYRFRLDTPTIGAPSAIPPDVDTRRPRAFNLPANRPYATKQVQVSWLEAGVRHPAPIRAFVLRASGIELPVPITDDHLATDGSGLTRSDDRELARYRSLQVARRLAPQLGPAPAPADDPRNAFYVEFRTGAAVDGDDDGVRIYPADRVGYSVCAPEGAEIEVVTTVDDVEPGRTAADGLLAAGTCSAELCPIAGASIRLAGPGGGESRDLAIYLPGRLPIDPESYRGWALMGVTTEFLEATASDEGGVSDAAQLSTEVAPIAGRPELLPTLRNVGRLESRLRRAGTLFDFGTDLPTARAGAAAALYADGPDSGPCGAMPARDCIRARFSSQLRVHPLTSAYRALAGQSPQQWTYCTDNPRRAAPIATEPPAGAVAALSLEERSRIGIEVTLDHYCSVGPDAGLWIAGHFMSASRLGAKDLADPLAEALEVQAAAPPPADLVHYLPRVSQTQNSGVAAAAWLGLSRTTTSTTSVADVLDMNGDGFPDQVLAGEVYVTDPGGHLRCLAEAVWADRFPCALPADSISFGSAFARRSTGETNALSIPLSSPKTFATGAANAAGRVGAALRGASPTQAQASRDPALVPLSIGAEFSDGRSERQSDLFDMNGDGLPDLVAGSTVNLNFGHAFAGVATWADGLMREESVATGLAGGLGYGNDIHEYGGGVSASSSRSRQTRILADVNGDGLVDVVWAEGRTLMASLNTGFGFASTPIAVGRLDRAYEALGQGESDLFGANAYFTFSIPIPIPFFTFYIVLNPGASAGATLNRQVIAWRDMDADGLPDLFVGGGLKVADTLKLMFDDRAATAYANPFGTHGLLTRVYLPTNPEAVATTPAAERANYQLRYARSTPSDDDPQSRYTLSEVIARDGLAFDDAFGVSDRRTCHIYESGYYERFERRFLGFAKVVTVEGCRSRFEDRPRIQLDAAAQARVGAGGDLRRDGADATGIRRVERVFANRSVYEAGTLLAETTTDLSLSALVAGATAPIRTVEHTYVLLDVGRSSATRRQCFVLGAQPRPPAGDTRPQMREMLGLDEGGLIPLPAATRDDAPAGPCQPLPAFDRRSLRLAPILVQSVRTTTEDDAARLVTAVQFAHDHLGRVTLACDLGRLADKGDDVCTRQRYNDAIQLTFIHGATGGGTLAFDRRDRVDQVLIRTGARSLAADGPDPDRRRTASYDPATGDLVALCQFEDVAAHDPCAAVRPVPVSVETLSVGAAHGVAVRFYGYDAFGNVDRSVSPVSGGRHYLSRRYEFDGFQHLVEVEERSDYCRIGGGAAGPGLCAAGSASELGTFVARAADIDWRHAVATTQVDVNGNALRTLVDGTGRPTAVFATWAGAAARAPNCTAGECTVLADGDLKSGIRWGEVARYAYRVGVPSQAAGRAASAVARVTRLADATLYKATGSDAAGSGLAAFDTDYHHDQLGRHVRTIAPADICLPGAETADGAACDPARRGTHVATGIATTDAADRVVDTYLPVALTSLPALADALVGPLPGEDLAAAPRTRSVLDGFDRPLHVRLPDRNGYAFRYRLAEVDGVLRHRAILRDARCVPTAIERDERGLIRGVHEFMNAGGGSDFDAHAEGSSPDTGRSAAIVAAGWVRAIDVTAPSQQVVACLQGDLAAATEAAPAGRLETALDDPFAGTNLRRRRASTLYDYDALSQLVGVRLPSSSASPPPPPVTTSGNVIQAAYDALGRRFAVDDPDRGFEHLSLDLVGNVTCRRSGPHVAGGSTAFRTRIDAFREESRRTRPGADAAGEDLCLAPEAARRATVARVIGTDYLYDRPSGVTYTFPTPLDGARKNVAIGYGRADDVTGNRAGRPIMLTDASGITSTEAYHPLGMPERVQRELRGLQRGPNVADSDPIGTLSVAEPRDVWGLLRRSALAGTFHGVRPDGSTDTTAATALTVSETIRFRYATGGQVNEVRIGAPCPLTAAGAEDCRGVEPATTVIRDAAFDERGNPLRLAYGHGVVTSSTFDATSNRLLGSTSRIGVACVEYGPGDDCSASAPPILFQNLSYAYDATGLLTAYDNAPRYADPCRQGGACPPNADPPITKAHAGLHGLLITGSSNRLSYDERGRLRSTRRQIATFGRNNPYWALDDGEFARARAAEVRVGEDFAFSDSHLLTGIRRSTERRFAGDRPGGTERVVIRHEYGSDHPTAPSRVRVDQPGSRDESQRFHLDRFGRVERVDCAGCLTRPVPGEGAVASRRYDWDPDDTLAVVHRRLEAVTPEADPARRRDRRYAETGQLYDHAGNRVVKRLTDVVRREDGVQRRRLQSETVYADERLTVTRAPNARPEALLHVFAGAARLASKRVGSAGLFTYHAQLVTRSVSDVVYARGDDPNTARLHQQIEYTAFGDLLLGRERTITPEVRDNSGKDRLARPLYRFNAKELDEETQLTYFGARHYDQRLGLWLSPDPALEDYLSGSPNAGVYAPKSLSAYAFAWGSPTNFRDDDGRVVNLLIGAVEGAVVGTAFQFAEMYLDQSRDFSWKQLAADTAIGAATSGIGMLAKAAQARSLAAAVGEQAVKRYSRASEVQSVLRDIATRSEKIYARAYRGESLLTAGAEGTKKHEFAARLLKLRQARTGEFMELEIERSIGGQASAGRFPRGSVRPDVYDPVDHIAYDYKFTTSGQIGRTQHISNMRTIEGLTDTVPVVPDKWYRSVLPE